MRLAEALSGRDVECEITSADETWRVWVHDELQVKEAEQLMERWATPEGQADLGRSADIGRERKDDAEDRARENEQAATRMQAVHERLQERRGTPLTFGLIAICIGVFFLSESMEGSTYFRALTIVDPILPRAITPIQFGSLSLTWISLPWEEPWRLVTPILMHAGLLHVAFNMWWFKDLGAAIEIRHGSLYLAAFVLVSGVISNVAQLEIEQSANFAGMSGVVYGFLGLIWVRGKMDRHPVYALPDSTLMFMLAWMALGFIPQTNMHLANYCHLGGLLVGVAWGAVASKLSSRPHAFR
jgi:GlpG protein